MPKHEEQAPPSLFASTAMYAGHTPQRALPHTGVRSSQPALLYNLR
jgi:hypothetical protein